MRRGFSLIEIVLVLVLMGLVTAIAIPAPARQLASIEAESAAQLLVRAHARARVTALLTSHVTLLRLTPDSLVIQTVIDADTVTTWRVPGPARRGISMSGPTRALVFLPIGVSYGFSNGTWTLEYRGAVRKVITSRYGRLRMVRQ